MGEITFAVEEAPEGGYVARALGAAVFIEADTPAELREAVRDAVRCHFEEGERPKVIRLHLLREGGAGCLSRPLSNLCGPDHMQAAERC